MKLENNNRKSYEKQFYRMQGGRLKPIRGILIYEQARRKLDISEGGSLYRQKWFAYIPFFGAIFAMMYAFYCMGKIKCLRIRDEHLFDSAKRNIKIVGFLIWPLIFLGFWTLLSFLIADFSVRDGLIGIDPGMTYGSAGSYAQLWINTITRPLNTIQVVDAGAFFNAVGLFFGGLAKIFIFPFLSEPKFGFGNTLVNCNIIFIVSFLILTIINPVNLFNTFTFNNPRLRFTIVFETSSIYRYRNR